MSVVVQKLTAVYSLENLLHTHLGQHCVKHSLLTAVLTNTVLYIVCNSRVSQHLLVASRHAGGNKLCRHNCVVYGSGKRFLVRTYICTRSLLPEPYTTYICTYIRYMTRKT